ncbi:SCO family protein [Ornithinibacillus sp. L9]|uniref:SCO family protein n=1 Tax=Ornithinibacillus caprae TaxID=2678566 RepID=A0A6N8FPW5_9BACI|nr:SCO family protein [Ornithinibacillus caprae]MUK90237.1 SCO family protein [Ornithinibacillus caprae]
MLSKLKVLFTYVLFIFLLSACGSNFEPDFSYEINDFTFINQDGEEVSKQDLEGKIWLADFIYTSCETECPQMTYNKQKIERALNDEGINDVEFVSFSVDPETDTPEVLREYGEVRGIKFDQWTFLTGYDLNTIEEFARESFKTTANQLTDTEFIHGVSFYLVTREGNAEKSYNGYLLEQEQIDEIVNDIKSLN